MVVARAAGSSPALADRLAALGAEVEVVAATRIEPLDPARLHAALRRLEGYRWIAFTSQHAVRIVIEELTPAGVARSAFDRAGVIAVGPATARALAERGITTDIVPARFQAEAIVEALAARGDMAGSRLLYPAAEGARDVLAPGVRTLGAEVDVVPIYRSVADAAGAERLRGLQARGRVDLIVTTSGSSARTIASMLDAGASSAPPVASIGPVTSAVAREAGLRVAAEARNASADGLVEAIVAWARMGSR